MATPASRSEDQGLVLDISDYNEVYLACKPVSVYWRDLGVRLGVLQYTLATIEADRNGKVEMCMSTMLDKWLRRPLGEVCDDVKPTWKSLCVALSHIDRPLAERLAKKHDYGDISGPVKPSDVVSPAFLPQMCGCGKCTIIGWRSGDSCQLVRYSKYPKLLVIDHENPSASLFKQSYDKNATLFHETSDIIEQFEEVVGDIWGQLLENVENCQVDIMKITRLLCIRLGIKVPMSLDLDSLQNLFHSLRVSWYNFRPLHILVTRILASKSPTLLADWNTYLTRFKEYCSARNLKEYSHVFFRVENHNIFLLEVDEHYYNFTLSDIEALCNSLSIALGCPSVCFHLVTVRGGSLIIYLYYSYSDYLTVFQSLTTEQLKMISQIETYRILSLADFHNEFRYDNIQSYAEVPPQKNVAHTELKGKEELNISMFKEKADLIASSSEEMLKKEQLHSVEDQLDTRSEATSGFVSNPDSDYHRVASRDMEGVQFQDDISDEMSKHEVKRLLEKKYLNERIETMRGDIERLQQRIKVLNEKSQLSHQQQQDLDQKLLEAVENNINSDVERILSSGANVNYLKYPMVSPLHLASEKGHQTIVETLINHGAIIEAKDSDLCTPLHLASKSGHQNIVETLVCHGAMTEANDHKEYRPLHLASERGHQNVVETLINHGAIINPLTGLNQYTPLHLASERGHQNVVETLINHGAIIKPLTGWDLHTPVELAVENGHQKVVETLISHGIDNKHRLLLLASEKGQKNVVETLINHGAIIETLDKDGRTPLHLASLSGHQSTVETLMRSGATIEARDRDFCTPLHLASLRGHQSTVETLIRYGAMIKAKDQDLHTPVELAVENGHQKVVETLISHGIDNKHRLLLLASEKGQKNVVETLINHGAIIETLDKDGRTPLHLASLSGHQSTVETLMRSGATIEARDRDFCIPLHLASLRGHQSTVETLIRYGAIIEAKDRNGCTPLHLASKGNYQNVVETLIHHGAKIEMEVEETQKKYTAKLEDEFDLD